MESQIGLRGGLVEPIYFSFPSRYQLAYVKEMQHFLNVIQGDDWPLSYGSQPFLIQF